eukprot:g16438.t1
MEWNPNVLKESGGLVDPPTTEEELLRVLVPVEYPAKVAAAATNQEKNGKNSTKNADLGRRPPPPEQKASSSTSSAHTFGVSSWASAARFDFTQARDGVSSEDFADHVDDHAEQLAHRTFALAATPTPAARMEATEALPDMDFLMHSVSSSGGRSEFEAGARSEHQLTSSADEDRLLSSGGPSVDVRHGSSKKSSSSGSGPTLGAAPARSSSSGGGVRASNRPSSPGGLKSSSAGPGYDASPFGAELKRVSNVDLRAPGKPRASTTGNDSLGLEEDVAADDARFKGAKPTVSNPVARDAAHPFHTQHQRHQVTPQQQRAQHYVGKADFFADGLKDRVVTDREHLRKGVRDDIPDDRLKVIADFLESEKAKKLNEVTRKKEKKKKAKKLQTYQQAKAAYKKVKAAGKVVPQAVKAALAAGRNFKIPSKPAPLAKSYSKQYQQALSGWPKVGTKLYSLKRFAKKADDFEAELRELPQKDANRILPQQDYAGISILGDGNAAGDPQFLRVMKGSHGFKRSTLLGTPTVSLEDATPALRNGDKFVRGIRVNENLFSQIGHAAERGIQEFRRQIFTHVSGHTDVFNARERQRNYLEEEIGRMYSIPPFTPWDARSEFWFRGYAQEVKMNMVGAEGRGVGFFQYDLRTVTGYRGVPEEMFGRGPEAYLQAVAGLSGAEIAQMGGAGVQAEAI